MHDDFLRAKINVQTPAHWNHQGGLLERQITNVAIWKILTQEISR